MDSERRSVPRYQFVADAKVVEVESGSEFAGRISDLSIHGCFIDLLNPSPQGTDLRITIFRDDATFDAEGKVIFALANMGMGIMFTRIEEDQLRILQQWL
jgi:hypothetical protein